MNCHDFTHWTCWILVVVVTVGVNAQKQHKRQIYREQVLPALGGKIPEEAFRTDRLALNRLNKDGITVVDGVLLEAREHDKNPDTVRSKPDIIQVYVTQDSRYVPPEGRYQNERPRSVDTTYVIRKPIGGHQDQAERTKQAFHKLPTTQRSHDRPPGGRGGTRAMDSTNKNPYIAVSSTVKSSRDPSRGSSLPKAHGYANFYRFTTPMSNNRIHPQQQNYRTIYEPIVSPLVVPNRDATLTESNSNYNKLYNHNQHPSALDLTFAWNPFYQQTPQSIFFEDSDGLFLDSHRVLSNYEGFFNDFPGRRYRHVESSNGASRGDDIFSKYSKGDSAEKNIVSTDRKRFLNIGSEEFKSHDLSSVTAATSFSTFTDLTSLPETSFSCDGRTGALADVETKCQAFHECARSSRVSSSLCPVGTAYSAIKKRCEWWNTVNCGF